MRSAPLDHPPRWRASAAVRGLLVQLRKEAGLNQTVLAARLGMTQSQASKYERGERGLDDARLRAWLSALGVSQEAFDAALERHAGALSDPSGAATAPRPFGP